MKDMLTGFRTFMLRGNLIDLGVAFVIGLAFVALISSLVTNLITPLISMLTGDASLRTLDFEINDSIFRYGAFIDDLIIFIVTAAAVYFAIVVPYNQVRERRTRGQPEPEATTKSCPECLSDIPIAARRCAYCTAQIA